MPALADTRDDHTPLYAIKHSHRGGERRGKAIFSAAATSARP